MNLDNLHFDHVARERKTDILHLAREFVQLEILRRISDSELRRVLCFKGGTALHLVFNLDRYSEDLDFSITVKFPPEKILSMLKQILTHEEITDYKIKHKTVIVEIRQRFHPQNFRVKLEINIDDIAPSELKTIFSEYIPASFTLQIMRSDYLVAQKIRALLSRQKGRDLYDLWFILRIKLPIVTSIASGLTGISEKELLPHLEKQIESMNERKIYSDLSPFIISSQRDWARENLKKEAIQLLKALVPYE
jgi:predicted nucleotidyltransferase component of viral defense system